MASEVINELRWESTDLHIDNCAPCSEPFVRGSSRTLFCWSTSNDIPSHAEVESMLTSHPALVAACRAGLELLRVLRVSGKVGSEAAWEVEEQLRAALALADVDAREAKQ